MADNATLMALLGGLGSGGDVSDIGQFQQDVRANDPYRMAAAPILGARFNTSTWSPMETLGVTAGQSFLGAALGALGARDEASQLSQLNSILPQLYENPLSVSAPQGMDPAAFGRFKASQIARDTSGKAKQLQKMAEDLWGVNIKGAESQASEMGKIQGQNKAYGITGIDSPDSPQSKIIETKKKDEDNLRVELLTKFPEITQFKEIKNQLGVLKKAAKDPRAVSDLDYVYGAAKILDPGSVVRESDAGMVIESNSIPASTLGYLNQMVGGGKKIDDKQRSAIYDLARRHYDTRSEGIGATFDRYVDLAKKKGIDRPEDVLPFSKDSLKLQDEALPPLDKAALAQEAAALKAQGKTTGEIAATLRAKYGSAPRG